jgi:inner membrane protein
LEGIVSKTEGERTPGFKLLLTILIGVALAIPLFSVWALVYDRQSQSEQATARSPKAGADRRRYPGPVLVIPYRTTPRDRRRERSKRHRSPRDPRELTLTPRRRT